MLVLQPVDQMNLGADRPLAARRGGLDLLDDVGGAAGHVGLLHDLPLALGVDDHLHVRVVPPHVVDVLGAEQGVDRAVALPQHEVGVT